MSLAIAIIDMLFRMYILLLTKMLWTLRIGLWHNKVLVPFNIQKNVDLVHKHLLGAIVVIADEMPGWKVVEDVDLRAPGLATKDERKLIFYNDHSVAPSAFIDFSDYGEERITIEEWKQFGKLIEREINVMIQAKCDVILLCDISSQ